MQSEERFGIGVDNDGDGFVNELTRADVTAASIYQAALQVPGRVIGSDRVANIQDGEALFASIGCASCHMSRMTITNHMYTEPNPYNPAGNLQQGQGVPNLTIDLTDKVNLPRPRLVANSLTGLVTVPAYTDLKVHDITTDLPGDPDHEPLDMNQAAGSTAFFLGNNRFITRKLWGVANQHSFGHHGMYTTMKDSVLAHNGEALPQKLAFQALSTSQQSDVIEFLKSLQILPENVHCLVVNESDQCIQVPPGIQP